MRKLALICALALIASPMAMASSWAGDVIFGWTIDNSNELANAGLSNGNKSEVFVSYMDFNPAGVFAGGDINAGDGAGVGVSAFSEFLGDSDPSWAVSRNCTAVSREIIAWDADTYLELVGGQQTNRPWVWLTQLEHDAAAAYETGAANQANYGTAWIEQTGANGASGGQLSGRLALGTDTGYNVGADPRFIIDPDSSTFGMNGATDVWGGIRVGNDVMVVGRSGGAGQIVKVPVNAATLANAAGQRVGDVATPASLLMTDAAGTWYTGGAEANGKMIVNDRGGFAIKVIDAGGAILGSFDMAGIGLIPEDLDVLSVQGDTARVVVNVFDPADTVKLAVLDVDLTNGSAVVVNTLQSGGLFENGLGGSLGNVDEVVVSPGGDLILNDSRGSNDSRPNLVTAEELNAALTGDGSLQPIGVAFGQLFVDSDGDGQVGQNYARGVAFTPEPATLALLAMGGLALIRRRK
jgi:hypothetical protein